MALQTFSNIFILLWALWVAGYDLKFHLIRNRFLALSIPILWPILWIAGHRIQLDLSSIYFIGVLGIAGFINLIGMGDLKLALILAPWIHAENWQISLTVFVAVIWLQIFLVTAISRKFPKRVALAPALLLACAVNMAT